MKTYEKYKDSGIEWIGEIPEHWKVKRLKRFAKICNGQDHKSVYDLTGDYPILGSGGEFGRANRYLHKGPSVLLGRKGTVDKPQYVDFPFWSVDTAYYTDIFPKTDPRFFYYLCTNIQFDLYKYGSAVPSMNQETLSQIEFPSPSHEEQSSIATFLDRKTTEIDRIIANKQKLIALYEEEKQAVINQAVTKGLDPNVKLKDSGVEWLGEIPEHWEVKKLKYIVTLITEKANGDNLKIGLENIESKTGKYIETNTEFEGEGISFVQNDILYGKLRPYLAKVWIAEFEGAAVGDFFVIRLKVDLCSEFLKYRLLSTSFTDISNGSTFGAKMPRVSWEFMSDLFFGIPSIEEQQSIVFNIEKEYARLDTIIEKFNKQIDLLKEYRTTLISEVVTGKVKVTE